MKKARFVNWFYGFVIALSACSFVYINSDQPPCPGTACAIEAPQQEAQEDENGSFALPDVELLKNLLESLIYFIPVS